MSSVRKHKCRAKIQCFQKCNGNFRESLVPIRSSILFFFFFFFKCVLEAEVALYLYVWNDQNNKPLWILYSSKTLPFSSNCQDYESTICLLYLDQPASVLVVCVHNISDILASLSSAFNGKSQFHSSSVAIRRLVSRLFREKEVDHIVPIISANAQKRANNFWGIAKFP